VEKQIIFNPKPASNDNPSYLYAASMGSTTLRECCLFFWDFLFHTDFIAITNKHIKQFAKALLQKSHTRLEVAGLNNFNHKQSYVFMSNHPSLLDIPALFEAIPQPIRMVTKNELFYIPVFGQALTKAGFIRINRKNKTKAIEQLETAKVRIRQGISVWISPEGTRSRSPTLGQFKKGGFHIALDLGVPIVPIWIEGTAEVMRPDSLLVYPNQKVTVYFGKPIQTIHLKKEHISTLMDEVRLEIEKLKPS